jgi:hypothetical protein
MSDQGKVLDFAKKHKPLRRAALWLVDRLPLPGWARRILGGAAQEIPVQQGHEVNWPPGGGM